MVYFQTKNPNLGKFYLECLAMKDVSKFNTRLVYVFYCHFAYIMAIWYILRSFWYIFPLFGILYQEQSGTSVWRCQRFQIFCYLCCHCLFFSLIAFYLFFSRFNASNKRIDLAISVCTYICRQMLQMTTKASSIGEPSVHVLVNVLLGQVLWNDKKTT
jgi:hypothetical protein